MEAKYPRRDITWLGAGTALVVARDVAELIAGVPGFDRCAELVPVIASAGETLFMLHVFVSACAEEVIDSTCGTVLRSRHSGGILSVRDETHRAGAVPPVPLYRIGDYLPHLVYAHDGDDGVPALIRRHRWTGAACEAIAIANC